MDPEKRKIIVAEIEHWQRSKLLPENYCVFLLNLYRDEVNEKSKSIMGVSKNSVRNSSGKQWLTIFGIIGLISFLGLHFTSFQFWMQTGISGVIILILYLIGAAQRYKQPVISYFSFGAASVALLMAGLFFLNERDMSGAPLLIYVGLCSMVWIVTGIMARMGIFHFTGWIVLFLIYAVILRNNITDLDWIGLELSWVPVSLVLAWLGWLFHHVNKQIAAVLLLTGVIAWFGAEVYGLALTELDPEWLQAFLLLKLLLAFGVLFGLRKKWIEWVV